MSEQIKRTIVIVTTINVVIKEEEKGRRKKKKERNEEEEEREAQRREAKNSLVVAQVRAKDHIASFAITELLLATFLPVPSASGEGCCTRLNELCD